MSTLDTRTEAIGEIVDECVKAVRAFLTYQGDNPMYHQKAKAAGGHIASYVKAEATKTNRMIFTETAERTKELKP